MMQKAEAECRAFLFYRLRYGWPVLAFLKRRWILLLCSALLLLGSMTTRFVPIFERPYERWCFGTGAGYVGFGWTGGRDAAFERVFFHTPMVGSTTFQFKRGEVWLPIWLPLSVVLGWLVWRELRWREKRARKAEQP